jgi:hypothetical protein
VTQPAQRPADSVGAGTATPVPGRPAGAEPTGHDEVDAVLALLPALDGLPVSDHVAVFESAHDRLRGALATAGETPAQPARG